jgi:hypothetical protein
LWRYYGGGINYPAEDKDPQVNSCLFNFHHIDLYNIGLNEHSGKRKSDVEETSEASLSSKVKLLLLNYISLLLLQIFIFHPY